MPITRTGDLSTPVTLNYQFAVGSADAQDFSRGWYSGSVTLEPGMKLFTLAPVTAVDDQLDEFDQSFFLDISLASGSSATITGARTRLTIKDNDAAPTISIAPIDTVKNEDGGSLKFRVSLDRPSEKVVTFDLKADGSSTMRWGQDAHFVTSSGTSTAQTLTSGFLPKQTQKDIVIGIGEDKILEPDETVKVSLVGATNITNFGQINAEATIKDNDVPTVMIDDAGSIYEGNAPGASANFNIRVAEAMERAVHVKYWTAAGDADSTSDYVSKSGTLTFGGAPGWPAAPSQQTVSVALRADAIKEVTAENFYLGVGPIDSSAANRLYAPKTYGKATIVDDDAPPRTYVGTPMPKSATPMPESGWGGEALLSWAPAINAVRYEIQLRGSTMLGEKVIDYTYPNFVKTPITGTTFRTGLFADGEYFWRVRAVAADGTKGEWSSEHRFVIAE